MLRAAMEAFWKKGYEATSLTELCSATGLHKGSLYQSFGDKHQLFMRSLEHYMDKEFREVAAVAFQSDSPLENLKVAVRKICDVAGQEKGCLMINSMVELAPHDPAVKALIRQAAAKRRRVMTEMISKAQQAGEIRPELDPSTLALQLMVTLAGAAATAKGLIGKDDISCVFDCMIESWT